MRRYKMDGKTSRRQFSRTAGHTHSRNLNVNPMRGGIKLT